MGLWFGRSVGRVGRRLVKKDLRAEHAHGAPHIATAQNHVTFQRSDILESPVEIQPQTLDTRDQKKIVPSL